MGALIGASALADTKPPAEGAALPAFSLPSPKDADHRTYLGVTGKETFGIADIKAEVVLIEIFNMY
jgi:hypothetical protein